MNAELRSLHVITFLLPYTTVASADNRKFKSAGLSSGLQIQQYQKVNSITAEATGE